MSQYRDDLVAARIRCAGLEADLASANRALSVASARAREAEKQIDVLRDASPDGKRWMDGRWVEGRWSRAQRGAGFVAVVASASLLLASVLLVAVTRRGEPTQTELTPPPFELLLVNADQSMMVGRNGATESDRGPRYDDAAADAQMRLAGVGARQCFAPDPSGTAGSDAFVDSLQVAVVFDPNSGRASSVSLVSRLVGSKTGDCIVAAFMRARIEPYVGKPRAQSIVMGQTSK